MPVGQPVFVQKADGQCLGQPSCTITPSATVAGHTLLVGVVQAQGDDFGVAGITDSAGNDGFGNPLNIWGMLGSSSNNGATIQWWACKNALSITSLSVNVAGNGTATFAAFMFEYSGANGLTVPQLQVIPPTQNTVSTLPLSECVAAYSSSAAVIMLGIFTMTPDTFGSPMSGVQRDSGSFLSPTGLQLNFQVLENGTINNNNVLINGSAYNAIAQSFNGDLTLQAKSSDQLATQANLSQCTMQCFYLLLSGGLILNTQPGFFDQQDTSLVAGSMSLGFELAKISSNAALGMTRMETFNGIYKHGDTVPMPISPVDGYVYQQNELTYVWAVFSTSNPNTGWITGPDTLWYCGWEVDQTTGTVTCDEWYRTPSQSGHSNDGFLQVFTVAIRQKASLMMQTQPAWSTITPALIGLDCPQGQTLMQQLNDNAKFSVVAQECIYMGEFYNGQTVPLPVSPADGYAYSRAECKMMFSWRWTTVNTSYSVPAWTPEEQLSSMQASISASTGIVSCAIGWGENDGNNYVVDNTTGRIAVFAFCTRNPSRTAPLANRFAEIDVSLMYPGNPLPASLLQQIYQNINEAAASPEFFGPTTYSPGQTVPLPTSPIDGYTYARGELTYIWEWGYMVPDPTPPPGYNDHERVALFAASIDSGTGLVSTDIYRLEPGGPYDNNQNTCGQLNVLVIAMRAQQAAPLTEPPVQPPPGYQSYVEPS